MIEPLANISPVVLEELDFLLSAHLPALATGTLAQTVPHGTGRMRRAVLMLMRMMPFMVRHTNHPTIKQSPYIFNILQYSAPIITKM